MFYEYCGEQYSSYFRDTDYVSDRDEHPEIIFHLFDEFIEEMKSSGEYYVPGTTCPMWAIPTEEGYCQIWEGFSISSDAIAREVGEICHSWFLQEKKVLIYKELCWHLGRVMATLPEENNITIYRGRNPIINGNIVCTNEGLFEIDNIEEPLEKEYSDWGALYSYNFEKNEAGQWFFVPSCMRNISAFAPEEQLTDALKFYEAHQFDKISSNLRKRIEREKELAARIAAERLADNQALSEFIKNSDEILIPVVFHWPSGCWEEDGENAILRQPVDGDSSSYTEIGVYHADNPDCQYLYGIREKGWRGRAKNGMLINIPVARRSMHNGVLHLEVPSHVMGAIIGIGIIFLPPKDTFLRKV